MNEQFAKQGTKGIEEVSRHVNEYFGMLINKINNHVESIACSKLNEYSMGAIF
jgi:hypothetical protein